MSLRSTVLVAILLLVGCKHHEAPARDAGAAPVAAKPMSVDTASALATAVTEMQGFRDRACACADLTCAAAVKAELQSWAKAQAARFKGQPTAVTEQQQLGKLAAEAGACLQQLAAPKAKVDPAHVDALVTEAIVAMTGFRDQACACHDPTCAQAVGQAMLDWASKNAMKLKDAVPGDQQRNAMQDVSDEVQACLRTANAPK